MSIPPGRYSVQLLSGKSVGWWMVCSSILCGSAYSENVTNSQVITESDYTGVMEISARDVAVELSGVELTRVQ